VKLLNLYTSLIKMVILEENFKWHLEAFASELFIFSIFLTCVKIQYISSSVALVDTRGQRRMARMV